MRFIRRHRSDASGGRVGKERLVEDIDISASHLSLAFDHHFSSRHVVRPFVRALEFDELLVNVDTDVLQPKDLLRGWIGRRVADRRERIDVNVAAAKLYENFLTLLL